MPDLGPYADREWTHLEKLYAAAITRFDSHVGRIIQELKDQGIDEKTVILLTSDNGDENSYYKYTKRYGANGPLKGKKRFLYEGGIRVPMIARWPGRSYRSILARGVAIRDTCGRPSRMVGSHIDVSSIKETERLLIGQRAELLAAEKIQMQLLPKQVPDLPGFDLAGKTFAAELTAGDMYDYLPLDDGSLGLVVGGVTGHGFSAALLMATTHAYIRSLAAFYPDLCDLLTHVNSALMRETEAERFVTLILARVDPRTQTMTYVNAGHPSGYVLDASSSILPEG